eukprot:Hpha_TRINITY_DN25869_c0_g1::TRINITY_DN25869_c0_g1_i1::g.19932::m.19932/K08059/IFI30, GILT; interferon, gamma-inducible protein 30
MQAALAVAMTLAAPPVTVEIFTESYCPCAGTFHHQYQTNIMPLVESIAVLNRTWDGRWNGSEVKCFHGKQECRANTLQACAHHLAGDNYRQWLNYTVCINGPCGNIGCKEQYSVAADKALTREKQCAADVGLSWDALNTCFTGPVGAQLLKDQAIYDKQVGESYGMTGLPIVKVNGQRFSKFWDCNSYETSYHQDLVKAICDAYTGTDKPAACN